MKSISRIVFVLIVFLFFHTTVVAHSEQSTIDYLEKISDEALQMVKSSRYEDAKRLLDHFSDQFLQYTMNENTLSVDERRIVSITYEDAVEAVSSLTMDHEERINQVTKFRLAWDAIAARKEPLWTEMREPVLNVLSEVIQASLAGEKEQFHSHLNSFLTLYEIIYPSLKLEFSSKTVQELDALVSYVDEYREQIFHNDESRAVLEDLNEQLVLLFDRVKEDDADPSTWWVIITTGSIIIVTLSYVGWRKYIGMKEEKRGKRRAD